VITLSHKLCGSRNYHDVEKWGRGNLSADEAAGICAGGCAGSVVLLHWSHNILIWWMVIVCKW
jgi:hypothetical protein